MSLHIAGLDLSWRWLKECIARVGRSLLRHSLLRSDRTDWLPSSECEYVQFENHSRRQCVLK